MISGNSRFLPQAGKRLAMSRAIKYGKYPIRLELKNPNGTQMNANEPR
jgi:hypothetical protein